MKKPITSTDHPAAKPVSKKIAKPGDWRAKTLDRMRKLIKEAVPDIV